MTDIVGQKSLELMAGSRWYNEYIFSKIKPHLGKKIIEIGSGIGNFTDMLLENGGKVTATEIQKNYLSKLKRKFKNTPPCSVLYGDIEKNKFEKRVAGFDSAVSLNVFEHIRNDGAAFRNVYNKLKPGGKFFILVPSHMFLFGTLDINLGHFRRYDKNSLKKKLKQAGFKKIKLSYLNMIGPFGWFITGRILKKTLIPTGQMGIFNIIARPVIALEKIINPPFGLSVTAVCEK